MPHMGEGRLAGAFAAPALRAGLDGADRMLLGACGLAGCKTLLESLHHVNDPSGFGLGRCGDLMAFLFAFYQSFHALLIFVTVFPGIEVGG